MSTRSGKRIHGSEHENGLDNITEPNTERKTRAKSQKENYPEVLTEKKRKHYVKYPSEEDVATEYNDINEPLKSVRKSLRCTLKEQNTALTEPDIMGNERTNRQIRRAKRMLDGSNNFDPEKKVKSNRKLKIQITNDDTSEPVQIKMKKSNKKKNKRKSNSIVAEYDSEMNSHELNKNNTTVDSFYSAASFMNNDDDCEVKHELIHSSPVHNLKNTTCINSDNIELNTSEKTTKKKRKSTIKEIDNTVHSSMTKTNYVDNYYKFSPKIKINEHEFTKTTLIENIHSSPKLDNTVQEKSNKTKKLSIFNTSNDTNENLSTNNATFEIETVISTEQVDNSIVLNNTYSTEKRRKSIIANKANLSISNFNATFNTCCDNAEKSECAQADLTHVSGSSKKKRKSSVKSLVVNDTDKLLNVNLNTTYEKESYKQSIDQLDKQDRTSAKSRHSSKYSLGHVDTSITLNNTYDKNLKIDTPNSHNSTYKKSKNNTLLNIDANFKLNSTFNKQESNLSTISIDVTDNMMLDTTKESSRISVTSDDSGTENIVNTTPVLIESSIDDSPFNNSNVNMKPRLTPFKQSKFMEIRNATPLIYAETSKESEEVMSPYHLQCERTNTEVKATTPLKNEDTDSEVKTTTPLKRNSTYTEIRLSKPPLKRQGTYTEIKTHLKGETHTEMPDATPLENSESGNVSESVTPIKKDGKFVETEIGTPLKREGTFTIEVTAVSPKSNPNKTPIQYRTPIHTPRRESLPSPGSTPFPFLKNSTKKSVLNVIQSIEKSSRRSSSVDLFSRATKVMFCSPVDNPAILSQVKAKIIKSNLKGSNKSFVFDNSVSEYVRPPRKRSYTHSEAEDMGVKRKRLTGDQQRSVERLSRPRTTSASAKLQDPGSFSKNELTPSKMKISRTKLPNFAALHQKRFAKMESLDECQLRKAKRARQLLTPTAPVAPPRLDNTSPEEPQPDQAPSEAPKKADTPKKSTQLIEPTRGYTRFGFKLNLDVNPFSFPSKTTDETKPKKTKTVQRGTLPSLAGATNVRKEVAKQTIMREKSFTERRDVKRKENRTIIKGVRTNRRFELQMKMRNVS